MNWFRDREEAGRRLAVELRPYALECPIVLALPRGGVPVGCEIARALGAPLDVWVVKKVDLPGHPEIDLGAVAEGGYVRLDRQTLDHVGFAQDELDRIVRGKQREVEDRVRLLRGPRARPLLRGRTVLVVDDGIATGGTARAAVGSIRAHAPKAIVLATPVAARDTARALASVVEKVVCLWAPADLYANGVWDANVTRVSDEEAARLLERTRREQEPAGGMRAVT